MVHTMDALQVMFYGLLGSTYKTELIDLKIIISLRKSEVTVARISV